MKYAWLTFYLLLDRTIIAKNYSVCGFFVFHYEIVLDVPGQAHMRSLMMAVWMEFTRRSELYHSRKGLKSRLNNLDVFSSFNNLNVFVQQAQLMSSIKKDKTLTPKKNFVKSNLTENAIILSTNI